MKFALFTVTFAGFWGQHRLTLEEAIDKTAELGFDGVEIMGKRPHLSPLDYSLEDCKRLRDRLDRTGLELAALAGYTDFTGGMESAEVPFPEMQVAYIEALARRAQILGGDLVRVFSSYERPGVPYAVQWRRTVDAIRECADRAGEYGVSVGIQNHHDIGADTKTLGEMLLQIDRSNVIPMYDCWSIHLRGEEIAEGVRKTAPRMRFTTVADYVTLPRTHYRAELVHYAELKPPAAFAVPMGEGELDYKTFFDELEDAGFDGWVSYEMCSQVRDGGDLSTLERYAKMFLAYMENRKGRV